MSRYITGLLLSPNKTLQGIHDQEVWPDTAEVSRRAMHAAVLEAGWDSAGLLPRHRAVVAEAHRGRGLEVIGVDWTYAHHDRGPAIYATKRAYDQVAGRLSTYQTLVTAVEVQFPNYQAEEREYLHMTARDEYADLEQARVRLLDLLHYHKNRVCYRKRTDIAVAIVRELEAGGHFPHAPYAFDDGVLSLPLLQRTPVGGKQPQRFVFAEDDRHTLGWKLHTLTRQALGQLQQLVQGLFTQGQSHEQILARPMPA